MTTANNPRVFNSWKDARHHLAKGGRITRAQWARHEYIVFMSGTMTIVDQNGNDKDFKLAGTWIEWRPFYSRKEQKWVN